MGDYNSDPFDGDSVPGAIQQILDLPGLRTNITPSSLGGPEQAELQGGINDTHISDPAFDTADFTDTAPGNLRADYVLAQPAAQTRRCSSLLAAAKEPRFTLVGVFPFPSSDHRLVWVEVKVPGSGRR